MKFEDWFAEEQKVIEFLNGIDLESEITEDEEDIYDFMHRIEVKHPFKTDVSKALFDSFSAESFRDYLYKRFKDKRLYTFTREYIFVALSKNN